MMERTRITHIWIDENYVGTYNSLCTSHHYDITPYIKNNKHKIIIMVDNTWYPTKGGHMTPADTQINWNGITGEISINITNKIRLNNVNFYSNIENKTVIVKGNIIGGEAHSISLKVFDDEIAYDKERFHIKDNSFEFNYYMEENVKLWSEYNPHTYKMTIEIEKNGEYLSQETFLY